MLSFNVELHDITSLTEPMFGACSIECPAMIGAECPAEKGERCSGWSAKYSNAAAEVVHSWSMSSFQDEEAGDCDRNGWYGLFRTPEAERSDDNPMRAGVILYNSPTGGVQVTRYDTEEELSRDWAKIEAEEWECPNDNEVCSQEAPCPECTD